MLSTGGYRLEKTYQCKEMLEQNGLVDPRVISKMDSDHIAKKLVESGYDRGPVLTAMHTERLISFGQLADNFEKNEKVINSGSPGEVESLLKPIKGVGPMVIEQFLILRDTK